MVVYSLTAWMLGWYNSERLSISNGFSPNDDGDDDDGDGKRKTSAVMGINGINTVQMSYGHRKNSISAGSNHRLMQISMLCTRA